MQIDIHFIKTVHKDNPYQHQFDPNEFYTDENVIDIKNQISMHFNPNGNTAKFHLHTNDTTIQAMDMKIHNISKYELWGWWNKMLLFDKEFSGPELNIYFDLDTVIQHNISDIIHFAPHGKLTGVYCYWKPIDWERSAYVASNYNHDFKYATLFNSSIMMWHGNTLQHITDGFLQDREKSLLLFRGNDEYLARFHSNEIKVLPRGWCYSYFFGAEQGSEFFDKDKEPFVKRNHFKIRLLNGEGKRYQQMIDERQPDQHTKDEIERINELNYNEVGKQVSS